MEQKFSNNGILGRAKRPSRADLQVLREFCERERYELLLHRCHGIVEHLSLNAISSFLSITPQMLSKIRKDITFNTCQ